MTSVLLMKHFGKPYIPKEIKAEKITMGLLQVLRHHTDLLSFLILESKLNMAKRCIFKVAVLF